MSATITSRTDEGFEAIVLASPHGRLTATFVPSLNMICSSLTHDGEEMLFRRAGLAVYADKAKTCCIPLLHPWANRLGSNEYQAAGRRVSIAPDAPRVGRDANGLPNHGVLGGRTAWEVLETSIGANAARVDARYRFDDPALLTSFPFPHELCLSASLSDDALEITTIVVPESGQTVPVSFGWHPYFQLPGSPRESWIATLPVRTHIELDASMLPTGKSSPVSIEPARLEARTFDDLFTDIASPRVFAIEDARRRLEVEFDDAYSFVQVWAPDASPFVCIEPMTAAIDALGGGRSASGASGSAIPADPRFAARTVTAPEVFRATFAVRVSSAGA